jgi:hypothetical protein
MLSQELCAIAATPLYFSHIMYKESNMFSLILQDKSDEKDCMKIYVPDSYQSYIPPPTTGNNNDKFTVHLSVDLLDIQSIDEAGGTYVAPFHLYLRWIDSRLTYKSLHNNKVLNTLKNWSFENLLLMKDRIKNLKNIAIRNIWKPTITFVNTNVKQNSIDPTDDEDNLATIQVNNNYQ